MAPLGIEPPTFQLVAQCLNQLHDCVPHLIKQDTLIIGGYRVLQYLKHCPTNRKVVGSIPEGVTAIFHQHIPSGRTLALGSTLTEMSTRNTSLGGKGSQCIRLTTLPASVLKSGNLNLLESYEHVQACNGIALPLS
jgi:hypothetical protein